jgi:hypothetical protein
MKKLEKIEEKLFASLLNWLSDSQKAIKCPEKQNSGARLACHMMLTYREQAKLVKIAVIIQI